MPDIIIATNDTIKDIVKQEIKKYGLNADLNHIDVSQVTIMDKLFAYSQFNGDISQWDVGNVTSMIGTFTHSFFDGNISNWNVSNVKNIRYMFHSSDFNQDISNWDVSNVKDMSHMFNFSRFNQDISKWNISNVEYMISMFEYSIFNQDISKWDTSNVKYMDFLFKNSQFNQYIGDWNVSKVISMLGIFSFSNFNQDISKWDISQVKNKHTDMFLGSKFNSCLPHNILNKKNIELNLYFPYFNNFNSLSILIKQLENEDKQKLKNLFLLDPYFDISQNKETFLNLIHFINQHQFKRNSNILCDHSSSYPLLLCEIFNDFEDFVKNNKIICIKKIYYTTYKNLDILFVCLYKKPISKRNLSQVLETIFCQDYQYALKKFDELIHVLDKNINDFPFAKELINKFFALELKVFKTKNEKCLDFLIKNNKRFSDFYPYYSAQQKQELLKLTEVCITDFNKDYTIDI